MAFIVGTAASDLLTGTASVDTILGKAGNDIITGGASADNLFGDEGSDTFLVQNGDGNDYIDGGADYDTLKISAAPLSPYAISVNIGYTSYIEEFYLNYAYDLKIIAKSNTRLDDFTTFTSIGGTYKGIWGDSAANSISGFNLTSSGALDKIYGGGGNDNIWGNGGDDSLWGEAANDKLYGGSGGDLVSGGAGLDTLEGGAGNDDLTGGTDADRFVYALNQSNGSDIISDFQDGTDLIDIRAPVGLTFADLTVASINGGADTQIAYYGTYTTDVVLVGIVSSAIDASDFLFA